MVVFMTITICYFQENAISLSVYFQMREMCLSDTPTSCHMVDGSPWVMGALLDGKARLRKRLRQMLPAEAISSAGKGQDA
jgi:hypothetical protein